MLALQTRTADRSVSSALPWWLRVLLRAMSIGDQPRGISTSSDKAPRRESREVPEKQRAISISKVPTSLVQRKPREGKPGDLEFSTEEKLQTYRGSLFADAGRAERSMRYLQHRSAVDQKRTIRSRPRSCNREGARPSLPPVQPRHRDVPRLACPLACCGQLPGSVMHVLINGIALRYL